MGCRASLAEKVLIASILCKPRVSLDHGPMISKAINLSGQLFVALPLLAECLAYLLKSPLRLLQFLFLHAKTTLKHCVIFEQAIDLSLQHVVLRCKVLRVVCFSLFQAGQPQLQLCDLGVLGFELIGHLKVRLNSLLLLFHLRFSLHIGAFYLRVEHVLLLLNFFNLSLQLCDR